MYSYNWDSYPDSRNYREKVNNSINHFLDIETDSNDRSIYIPAVEIKETNQAFYLNLVIPGITKRQIDLEITSTAIIAQGERTISKNAEDEKTIFSNFRYGKWQQIIFLPVPIIIHAASTEYADGILKIVLYKLYSK